MKERERGWLPFSFKKEIVWLKGESIERRKRREAFLVSFHFLAPKSALSGSCLRVGKKERRVARERA